MKTYSGMETIYLKSGDLAEDVDRMLRERLGLWEEEYAIEVDVEYRGWMTDGRVNCEADYAVEPDWAEEREVLDVRVDGRTAPHHLLKEFQAEIDGAVEMMEGHYGEAA